MDPKRHWETVYRTKDVHEVSWFQSEARRSLDLITRVSPDRSAPIIDVGAGASVLVDDLLAAGYLDVSVLDVSEAALEISRGRLGTDAAKVKWMRADVRRAQLDEGAYAVWHDRAVFHFLTDAADRAAYVEQVRGEARRLRSRRHLCRRRSGVLQWAPGGPLLRGRSSLGIRDRLSAGQK